MKKLRISITAVAVLVSLFLSSCFNEEDAINKMRELALEDETVTYTVQVVDAATKTTLKSANTLAGAIVTVTQGDSVYVASTSTTGSVVFKTLYVVPVGETGQKNVVDSTNIYGGSAYVTITADGFADASYTVNFPSADKTAGGLNVSNTIAMVATSGAVGIISGKVTYEADLTNTEAEVAADASISAVIVASNVSALNQGDISQVSYDGISLTTKTDAEGNYSLEVPAVASGITYSVSVDDFAGDQTIFMNTYKGVPMLTPTDMTKSIPTIWGTSGFYLSQVPSVSSALVTIAAPDSSGMGSGATATAIMGSNKSVAAVNLTEVGDYGAGESYRQVGINKEGKTIPTDEMVDGDASVSLQLNTAFGIVDEINVNNSGYDFTELDVTFNNEMVLYEDSFIANYNYNYRGDVGTDNKYTAYYYFNDFSMSSGMWVGSDNIDGDYKYYSQGGAYLVASMPVDYGISATNYRVDSDNSEWEFKAKTEWNYDGYYEVRVYAVTYPTEATEEGTRTDDPFGGYYYNHPYNSTRSAGFKVVYTGTYTPAQGKLNLSGNAVIAVEVDEVGANYAGATIEFEGGDAIIEAQGSAVTSLGRIVDINVTNSGNYPIGSVPTVVIKAPALVTATATAWTKNGVIGGINMTNYGTGYTKTPAVTVTALGAGEGAELKANIGSGQVSYISVLAPGAGYTTGNVVNGVASTRAATVTFNGAGSKLVNFSLGQGQRSVQE